MTARAYPSPSPKSNQHKHCQGLVQDANGILVRCPELLPPNHANRQVYHSDECSKRTWKWLKRGFRLRDKLTPPKTWADPDVRKKRIDGMKDAWADQTKRKRIQDGQRKGWTKLGIRKRRIKGLKKALAKAEVREKFSARAKRLWAERERKLVAEAEAKAERLREQHPIAPPAPPAKSKKKRGAPRKIDAATCEAVGVLYRELQSWPAVARRVIPEEYKKDPRVAAERIRSAVGYYRKTHPQ